MLRETDDFYLQKEEPVKSCLMALRDYIRGYAATMTECWKYNMPCFCYKGKAFCYLWTDKKTGEPYILIVKGKEVSHPDLVQGERSRMKILPVKPEKDLPLETIDAIFNMARALYD